MKKQLLAAIFIVSIFSIQVIAQDYAASVNVGLNGFGAGVTRSFSDNFNLRAGFSYFKITVDGGGGTTDDYSYIATPKLTTINLIADYFPFENIIRVSGGLVVNLNAIDTKLTPTKTYTIGGDVYTPETLGDLNANIKFAPVAPYIGLGLGNPVAGDEGFSVTFDIGTFYQSAPKVDLTATGLLEPSASEDQKQTLEDNLSWFKWYPVLTIGFNYKF